MTKSLLFFLLIGLFSCNSMNMASSHSGTKHPTKEVIVASYRTDCVGVGPQMCYLYKENQEDEWIYFYSEIEGFDYQAGNEYVIKVKVSAPGNDYHNAKNLKFELEEVISKTVDRKNYTALYDTWGLLELNGEKVDIGKLERSPLIDINTIKKKIQGTTGCNSFSTTFTFDEKAIKIDFPFPMTERACLDYSIETEYMIALEKVDNYIINGVDLFFLSGTDILFKFRKVD